ncbi:ABC transporter permease [Halorussus halobius]|uniref:ABC transporter permease n=1 Tax=Halorussus halobius TaxID=1710537 RepID=UPI00109273B3|nr:ABC transporter permease [Halorussus halobius]
MASGPPSHSSRAPPEDAGRARSAGAVATRSLASRTGAVAQRATPPLLVAGLVLAAWWATARFTALPTVVFPSPGDVAGALATHWPTLLDAAGVTAVTVGLGVLGGASVGGALAVAMAASETAATVVRPYVVALRIVPAVAVAPLLFRWAGDGVPARALLAATLAVFPVTIATYQGLCATPEEYVALARSVGASRIQQFLRVRLPAAAPHAFAGLKIATVAAVVGAVVAEFLALDAGIGYEVFRASTYLRTARMVAALGVLAALGVGFYLIPALVERRFDRG